MLKAFIVDDEPLARDELQFLLIRSKQVEIVGEADCMEEAMKSIPETNPDIVFLDIELGGHSGLQLAEQLLAVDPVPTLIFATAYDEYALQAFDLEAFDYILKPFDEGRIQQTLRKISRMRAIGENVEESVSISKPVEQTGKLAILVEEKVLLINISAILFVCSHEGKVVVKTMEKEFKTGDSLVAVEKKLSNTSFIRVHRSYIVNIHYIAEIQPWFNSTYNLIMTDLSKVPVSRTYVKDLKQLFGL
ncbi:LytR/AlgR family response regulator transcription factor [Domibacillus epiphyticus]|uniref:DNA-binding response regulator n=1 Tax=Domibacillus epiphyticus TaxID=1714355 RepID=A0A1V2A7W9_9BACI|nr:LytTR family transcriptional regulator DNA-binding domain-containing protein [Domibacillus epiphyticus]OMP67030.1 DNA-binding response regulator [Domibacillus epiphyticus]